jgi:protease I
LADANLLQGKRATAAETDYIKSKGAVVVEEPVVQDGNIITANGPDASQEFAEAIVFALEGSGSDGNSNSGNNNGSNGSDGDSNQGISQQEMASALRVPLSGSGSEPPMSESSAPAASLPKYKCTKCSYIYDPAVGDPENGIPPGTPFEDLPSSWKCPWCGASKNQFVKA